MFLFYSIGTMIKFNYCNFFVFLWVFSHSCSISWPLLFISHLDHRHFIDWLLNLFICNYIKLSNQCCGWGDLYYITFTFSCRGTLVFIVAVYVLAKYQIHLINVLITTSLVAWLNTKRSSGAFWYLLSIHERGYSEGCSYCAINTSASLALGFFLQRRWA